MKPSSVNKFTFLFSLHIGVGILLSLCLFAAPNFAQSVKPNASSVTEFDVNGLKVLVKRRAGSQTVAAGLFFRGGSQNLTKANAGLEDMMLSVATEGSQKFPRETMRKELSKTGSGVGSGANYDFSVLSLGTTRQSFDRSWEIFTDVAIHPAFDKADVERIREQTLTGLRDIESQPESLLEFIQNNYVYAKHPYGADPNGTIQTVSKFTVQDLQAYHKSLMQTSHLLLVIVGDLNADELKTKITSTFGKLPRGNFVAKTAPSFNFAEPKVTVTAKPLPTNYIQGVFGAPSPSDTDFYAMRVANTILRDRIFEEVRVKRQLSYAPNAFMRGQSANLGGISVSAVQANYAVSVMLGEIGKLQTEAVQPEDISGVVGQFLTTSFLDQETNAAQAADLATYELIGGGWRKSFDFLDKMRKVTAADVQRVSNKYMKNLQFFVVGNPSFISEKVFTAQP